MERFSTFSKDMVQQPCETYSVYDFFAYLTDSYHKASMFINHKSDILKVARLLDEAGIVIYVSPSIWRSNSQYWFVRTVDVLEKDPDLWTAEETEKCLEAVFSDTNQAVLVDYLYLRDMLFTNKLHKIAIFFGVWNNGL